VLDQPYRPSPCARLSRTLSTTAVLPQATPSAFALPIPVENGGSWFPGSARRLCPRIEGGTTACVTSATLRSRLRPVMEPPQLSQREVGYDKHVPEPEDLASPPTALSWVCFVSGCILRGFDPAHPDPLSSPRSPLGTAISRTTAAGPPPG